MYVTKKQTLVYVLKLTCSWLWNLIHVHVYVRNHVHVLVLYVLQSSIAARDLTEVELLCHMYIFSIYTLWSWWFKQSCWFAISDYSTYSPPSEFMWVRCFSHFFRERSFKSRQNPRTDFFKARKGFNMEFFNCSWVLCLMDNCLQLPCIRVEEAILWTQRFLTRKFWLKIRSLFMTNKFKRKCLQKLYISSKQEKEWYRKMTSYLEQPSCHFNDTMNPFGCKLGESAENDKALLFFSGKETVQTQF